MHHLVELCGNHTTVLSGCLANKTAGRPTEVPIIHETARFSLRDLKSAALLHWITIALVLRLPGVLLGWQRFWSNTGRES